MFVTVPVNAHHAASAAFLVSESLEIEGVDYERHSTQFFGENLTLPRRNIVSISGSFTSGGSKSTLLRIL